MPKVEVSEHVKSELERVKKAEEHKTYDSVIRTLLRDYDE